MDSIHWKMRTLPLQSPFPPFDREPIATVLASDDNDTDLPDSSLDASPSISFPICCQGNAAMAVDGEGVGGEGVGGKGVGEIDGSAIALFGLELLALNHKLRNSTVAIIDVERIIRTIAISDFRV